MRFCLITTAAATLASLFSCSHAVPLLAERTDLGSRIAHHGHRALSISTVQARGNHPSAVEDDEPVKILLYITFNRYPRIAEQLLQRPGVGSPSTQAKTIVKTFLASQVFPDHKIDPFFVNLYEGPGVEETEILFDLHLHDPTKHAQCEFGCAGAVRRLWVTISGNPCPHHDL
ncbi:hypothetical protein F5880DRAFT_946889 [Lentinula raphanica]|nr:hypothetical protein F5880DRAFT_946889 [Lentinula raphanica]